MASFSLPSNNAKRYGHLQIGTSSSRSVNPDAPRNDNGKSNIIDNFQNPCAFHAKGWCIRGNSCSFPHVEQQGPSTRVDQRGRSPVKGIHQIERGTKQRYLFEELIVIHIKEVLEKLWVNGLVTKNGYKMTVKKSVMKIMMSFKPGDIPSSKESIESYIDSNRDKIEKLVMAYAGIYRNV